MTYTPETLRKLAHSCAVVEEAHDAIRAHTDSWEADKQLCRDEIRRADDRFDKLQDEWGQQRNTIAALRQRLDAQVERNSRLVKAEKAIYAELGVVRKRLEAAEERADVASHDFAEVRQRLEAAEKALWRIYRWDMMDTAADGTYWRSEIAAVLAAGGET